METSNSYLEHFSSEITFISQLLPKITLPILKSSFSSIAQQNGMNLKEMMNCDRP
jgi:hypothetical protein